MKASIKRIYALTIRNFKEILRDKTSFVFCIFLPVGVFVLLEALFGKSEQAVMFEINSFSFGIAAFGYTFIMLYIAITISNDRGSAFMLRIYASPTRSYEYIIGFLLAAITLSFFQTLIFYIVAICFGLSVSVHLVASILFSIITVVFYAACGILIGTLTKSDKQAGPLCSVIISCSGLLGGVWLPIDVIGGTFKKVCDYLPFYNGVELIKQVACGNYMQVISPLFITLGYAVLIIVLSSIIFEKNSK